MAASHFFVGLAAGAALLTLPLLALGPGLDVPGKLGAWIGGPPATPQKSAPEVASRPVRGYVPGEAAPAAAATAEAAPPTLAPASPPTSPPLPQPAAVAPPARSLGTGV